jgi:hypothetical protein
MLVFLSFLAALFFFVCAAFSVDLGIPLVDAGLTALAAGFVFGCDPIASRAP